MTDDEDSTDATRDGTASGVTSPDDGPAGAAGRDLRAALEAATRALDRRRPTGDADAQARRLCVLLAGSVAFATSFGLAAVLGFGLLTTVLGPWTGQVLLLLLPVVTMAYLVLLDGSDVARPSWPDGHPSLVDAWLLAVVAAAAVTVALWTPAWPEILHGVAFGAVWVVAYALAPVWLPRRCLARPNWELGTLAVVVTLLLLLWVGVAGVVLPPTTTPTEVAVAAPGLVAPYWLAAQLPAPAALGRRAAGALRGGVRR